MNFNALALLVAWARHARAADKGESFFSFFFSHYEHRKLISYRFVVDSSQMIFDCTSSEAFNLILDPRVKSIRKKHLC
jgi:hypothetical protein